MAIIPDPAPSFVRLGTSLNLLLECRFGTGDACALIQRQLVYDRSLRGLLQETHDAGIGVLVKKPLASGRIAPEVAIPFCLAQRGVTSLIIGTNSRENFATNCRIAASLFD